MIGKTAWLLLKLFHTLWVRAVAIGILGVLTALAGVFIAPWIPGDISARIGSDAVDQILVILASSMLTVVTFSLAVAVQAFSTAAANATPRATRLLQQDPTTQNVLATFVGAFLFSLVGIIALNAGIYGAEGRVVLFAATLLIVALVVTALLRWIDHLMRLGRMDDTLARVEKAAAGALATRAGKPYLGGLPLVDGVPADAIAVYPEAIGYVQHVDIEVLSRCAEEIGAELWLEDIPGSFVHPANPLLRVSGVALAEKDAGHLRSAYTIDSQRSFDQDPRFGVIVLSEIASRALSPGVNDPGTAIDVLGRLVRVLSQWQEAASADVTYPRLHVPPVLASELMEDAFEAIARDGAALIEVQVRLQVSLAALGALAPAFFGEATRKMAAQARERAQTAFTSDADKQRLAVALQELRVVDAPVRLSGGPAP